MDPARFDPTLARLSWVHPLLIITALLLALVVYTTGTRLREARTRKRSIAANSRRLHARLGRSTVLLLLGGFVTGPVSWVFVRDNPPLSTFHGWAGVGAAIAFALGGLLGLRLDAGRSRRTTLHGLLGLLGMLLGLVAAIAGIELLP